MVVGIYRDVCIFYKENGARKILEKFVSFYTVRGNPIDIDIFFQRYNILQYVLVRRILRFGDNSIRLCSHYIRMRNPTIAKAFASF